MDCDSKGAEGRKEPNEREERKKDDGKGKRQRK
jgi:hypothetical protein